TEVMIDLGRPITDKKVWTPKRLVAVCVVAGLLSIFGLLGCNSADHSNQNAPTNISVSRSSSPTAAAPVNNARTVPAGPVSLSPQVRDVTVKTLDGKSLKLSDYDTK